MDIVASHPIPRDARLYIAGHRGLVGSALWRHFTAQGFKNLIGRSSRELDLRDQRAVAAFFTETRPDVVVNAAAVVGGIAANSDRPSEFLTDNLRIQVNLLDSAATIGVGRFLFLGSSCIYPKFSEQPIREEYLLTGPLEESNEAYAIAKIAGIAQVKAIRRQYGLPYVSAMPTSLYGPGDNFHPHDSHVLPALIARFHEAMKTKAEYVTCWGSGEVRRDFLHVDDLAEACHVILDHYDEDQPINIGTGSDLTVAELARLVAGIIGYNDEIRWNVDKPDGTPRKVLDVQRLNRLGWKPTISLEQGVRATYEWYVAQQDTVRT